MKNSVAVVVAVLAILANYGMAQEAQDQNTAEAVPLVTHEAVPATTKYDKMDKKSLQEELKRLQKEILVAEHAARQAREDANKAGKAYATATDEKKPDLLLAMIEAQAKSEKPYRSFEQVRNDFDAAQRSYRKLLLAEEK